MKTHQRRSYAPPSAEDLLDYIPRYREDLNKGLEDATLRFRRHLKSAESEIRFKMRYSSMTYFASASFIIFDPKFGFPHLFKYFVLQALIVEPPESPSQERRNMHARKMRDRQFESAAIDFLGNFEGNRHVYLKYLAPDFEAQARVVYEKLVAHIPL